MQRGQKYKCRENISEDRKTNLENEDINTYELT